MTAKTKMITAQQYLDMDNSAFLQAHRERLITALRASSAPKDVIAEAVAQVQQASDADIEAMMMEAADTLPYDEHDEIMRTATANIVTALYRGDCELAIWLLQLAIAKGEASVREMLADFDATAVLAKARDVANSSAN